MENSNGFNIKKIILFMVIFAIVDEVIPDLFIQNPHYKLIYKIITKIILAIIIVTFLINNSKKDGYNSEIKTIYIALMIVSFGFYVWFNLRGYF